jgi:hypothetical protein
MNRLLITLLILLIIIIIGTVLICSYFLSARFVKCSKFVSKLLDCSQSQAKCFLKLLADYKIKPTTYQNICRNNHPFTNLTKQDKMILKKCAKSCKIKLNLNNYI